jgi:hypothetical protein
VRDHGGADLGALRDSPAGFRLHSIVVFAEHLAAYLDEMTWRFNNRDNPFLFRDTMMKLIQSDKLEYKELTAA